MTSAKSRADAAGAELVDALTNGVVPVSSRDPDEIIEQFDTLAARYKAAKAEIAAAVVGAASEIGGAAGP